MAGGNGTRLGPLTRCHAKPALPFGGEYRNIDFSLSNCFNSGIRRMSVLTQYKANSLIRHIRDGWSFLRSEVGEFVELWPAQQGSGRGWYAGTADAVYQNLDLIREHRPRFVLVLAGDHIYKMDYAPMIEAHAASGADATVSCIEVPIVEASAFGIMAVDEQGWVREFAEKPEQAKPVPGRRDAALASMGVYVFGSDFLYDALAEDAQEPVSSHDFGRDVWPSIIGRSRVRAHSFRGRDGAPAYWRDVGTLDSYWQAHMELLADEPALSLYDALWPIHTHRTARPPSTVTSQGRATGSIIAGGSTVAGVVESSVLFSDCRVGGGSRVEACVVLPGARIGRNCRLSRVIVDSGCVVPDDTVIGEDFQCDARCYEISPSGLVVATAEGLAAAELARAERKVA
jgi:glucose-1-phosphate adenylyltransferase